MVDNGNNQEVLVKSENVTQSRRQQLSLWLGTAEDVPITGPLFTWCRKQDGDIVYEKLDRALVSKEWWDQFL
ncbi:hypothetical protein REPUB_Repub16aG0051000 [Reevesia pubescens]